MKKVSDWKSETILGVNPPIVTWIFGVYFFLYSPSRSYSHLKFIGRFCKCVYGHENEYENNETWKSKQRWGGWRLELSQIFSHRLPLWWTSTPPSLAVKLTSYSSMKSQSDVGVEGEDGTRFQEKNSFKVAWVLENCKTRLVSSLWPCNICMLTKVVISTMIMFNF